jgi:hypothetical protein
MTFGFVAARHIAGVDLSDDEPTSAAREHARAT